MSQASENIAKQLANAANVRKVWQDVIINVKEYGADGVGDDTDAFQQAINYAISKGKSDIWVPPGTYTYTTLLNANGITFYGDNVTLNGTTVLNVTSFHDMSDQLEGKADQTEVTGLSSTVYLKADKSYVDTQISTIGNASPKGTYATLVALQTAFPTGTTGIYVVVADGKWYYWNGSAWTVGGVYQSTGISPGSITNTELAGKSVNITSVGSGLTSFAGTKVSTTQAASLEQNIGFLISIDVDALNLVGASVNVQFDFFTKSSNIDFLWAKLLTSDVGLGDGESLITAPKWTVKTDTLYTYSNTFTLTQDKKRIHVFIWPTTIVSTTATEYFFKDVVVKINGSVISTTPYEQRIYQATGSFASVSYLDGQLTPYSYVNGQLSSSLGPINSQLDGTYAPAFVGEKATVTLGNAAQENNIAYVYRYNVDALNLASATVIIEFDFYTKSANVNKLYAKLYTHDAVGIGDGQGFDNGTQWTVIKGSVYHYTTTFTLYATDKKNISVYIWPTVFDINTKTEYFFKDLKVKVNGSYITLPTPYETRFHNATGTLSDVTSYYDPLATVGYVTNAVTNVATPPQYQGKVWNVLGDSITQGTGTTIKYHDYLKTELGFTTVNNYGIGGSTVGKKDVGDTSNSMALRYTTMGAADIITVFGGTNDASGVTPLVPLGTMADRTVDTFYGAYHVLLNGLIEKYVGKKIAVFTMIIRYSVANSLMNQYAQAIREVAAFYSIPCLDLFSSANIYSYSTNVKAAIIPDGIHPNEAGHRIMADRIGAFLKSI